jgi:hypothetical protein
MLPQLAQGPANKIVVIPGEFTQAMSNLTQRLAGDGPPPKPRPRQVSPEASEAAAADAEAAAAAARAAEQEASSAQTPGAPPHKPPSTPSP